MKLVASLLVRDELARYQPRLTEHLLTYVDEIRVLDDCSKDNTGAILDKLDWRVHVKTMMGSSVWDSHGEGAARQQLLDWTLAAKPTHVLAIDGDEFVPDGQKLREAIQRNPDSEAFTLTMREIWDRKDIPWHERVDGQWGPRECPVCWKVPATMGEGWSIRPLPMACGREPEIVSLLGQMGDAIRTGCDLVHLGWSNPSERRSRYDRYVKLDGGEHHASEHLASILEPPTLEAYPAYVDVVPADPPAASLRR